LENRNILKAGNVAPSLQAAQAALAHEQLADSLEKKIAARPDIEELKHKGVISEEEAQTPST
jgi:hypothetical protein